MGPEQAPQRGVGGREAALDLDQDRMPLGDLGEEPRRVDHLDELPFARRSAGPSASARGRSPSPAGSRGSRRSRSCADAFGPGAEVVEPDEGPAGAGVEGAVQEVLVARLADAGPRGAGVEDAARPGPAPPRAAGRGRRVAGRPAPQPGIGRGIGIMSLSPRIARSGAGRRRPSTEAGEDVGVRDGVVRPSAADPPPQRANSRGEDEGRRAADTARPGETDPRDDPPRERGNIRTSEPLRFYRTTGMPRRPILSRGRDAAPAEVDQSIVTPPPGTALRPGRTGLPIRRPSRNGGFAASRRGIARQFPGAPLSAGYGIGGRPKPCATRRRIATAIWGRSRATAMVASGTPGPMRDLHSACRIEASTH